MGRMRLRSTLRYSTSKLASLMSSASAAAGVASVPADAGLDEVLGRLLRSTAPLAVTGGDDEFLGMLSRRKVVELVTPVVEGREDGAGGESARRDAA